MRMIALADVHQRTDDITHHVMQECIRLEREYDQIALFFNADAFDGLTGVMDWHSAARNAEKSCSPKSKSAPFRIHSISSGLKTHPARFFHNGERTGLL